MRINLFSAARYFRDNPDDHSDDHHHDNNARPNARFKNVTDKLTTRQHRNCESKQGEIGKSFHNNL